MLAWRARTEWRRARGTIEQMWLPRVVLAMVFTREEIDALLWLDASVGGDAPAIPQRLVLRGYVDFDHAFKPKAFLTKRGATSARTLRTRRKADE